jgi:hypothetical protein
MAQTMQSVKRKKKEIFAERFSNLLHFFYIIFLLPHPSSLARVSAAGLFLLLHNWRGKTHTQSIVFQSLRDATSHCVDDSQGCR